MSFFTQEDTSLERKSSFQGYELLIGIYPSLIKGIS